MDAYVAHLENQSRESGEGGELPYGPYSRDDPFDAAETRVRALVRWRTPLSAPGWRRAWGVFAPDGAIVGSVHLAGGELTTALHRADCGIGIDSSHRRQGFGRRLMNVALEWARSKPPLDWIELGVFEGNHGALALYESLGFARCGRIPDRFRVDGHIIDDLPMVLWVGVGTSPPKR